MSALRHELNVNGKMHVFGGSWGSTLALAYAIAHPATVQTLILRGVFLCRRADVDYFFQGNAAEFAADPLAMPTPGAYLDFPTAWRHFLDEKKQRIHERFAVEEMFVPAKGEALWWEGQQLAGVERASTTMTSGRSRKP